MIKIQNYNRRNKIMHQLNEEVRCLRQTLREYAKTQEYHNGA